MSQLDGFLSFDCLYRTSSAVKDYGTTVVIHASEFANSLSSIMAQEVAKARSTNPTKYRQLVLPERLNNCYDTFLTSESGNVNPSVPVERNSKNNGISIFFTSSYIVWLKDRRKLILFVVKEHLEHFGKDLTYC